MICPLGAPESSFLSLADKTPTFPARAVGQREEEEFYYLAREYFNNLYAFNN